VELFIQNGKNRYFPVVEDGISWTTARNGEPGKLEFSVLKDSVLKITEGNVVSMRLGNSNVFSGFLFSKKFDKGDTVKVTAYDQLRYFKNKEIYQYENKTADQVIAMIAKDFNMQVGTLENTGFKIPYRNEYGKTLFDITQTALDLTLQNSKKMFVLYDDFGKLTLKNIENMKINLLIDDTAGEDFDYTSSIDGETYNKIRLIYDNEETGKKDVYVAQDSANMNAWGVLQYFEKINETTNGKAKADALLSLYNKKTRNLSIKNALGDIRVRAGSSIPVVLDLGDVKVQNYMLVEKCKHTFKENYHTMDLTLRGGEFIA